MAKKENKKVQYLLLVLVVVIWSVIIYRILNYTQNDEPLGTHASISLPTTTIDQVQEDSYTLIGGYDDPFFNGKKNRKRSKYRSNKNNSRKGKSSKTKTQSNIKAQGTAQAVKEEMKPKIFYKAFSLNNDQITKIKLEINGVNYTIGKDQEVQGIKVLEMNKNSVTVQWKKEKLVLNRT